MSVGQPCGTETWGEQKARKKQHPELLEEAQESRRASGGEGVNAAGFPAV
jgi:hypothetical protein